MTISIFIFSLLCAPATQLCAAVANTSAPWDRGSIYLLSMTNKPPPPPPEPPSQRQVLDELQSEAPTSLATVVLGAAQSLYTMTRAISTNLGLDAKTAEQDRTFVVMLNDVTRMTKEGRAEEAINMLKQQLNKPMPPRHRAAINNLIASYYFRMQRYHEALPFMREAVRLDPTDFPTLSNLAAVLMSMGELKEAGFFLRTIDTTKIRDNVHLVFSIYFNRACLNSLNNEMGAALRDLRQAAQTDPHSTLASLGDPQLDGIRPSLEFFDMKARLETIMQPTAQVISDGAPGLGGGSP